jgi:polar amino acid transport system substrate-binding protein
MDGSATREIGAGSRHVRTAVRGFVALSLLAALTACQYPRDPEGTLDRVTGDVVRAGIGDDPPWAFIEEGRPAGIEVDLIEAFARSLGARIRWTHASHEDLLEGLEEGTLDVVIDGITTESPWSGRVGLARPYVTTAVVVGFPLGSHVPSDIAGVHVQVERGSVAEGLLEHTDAVAVPVPSLQPSAPAAVDDWALDDLGLRPSGVELAQEQHTIAVRAGENAWLVRLEEFLVGHEGMARRLLNGAEP